MVRTDDDERLSRRHFPKQDLKALWERHETRWTPNRDRIREAREALSGEGHFDPGGLLAEDLPGRSHLVYRFSQAETIPLKTVSVLSRKRPRFKRHPIGPTPRAASVASNIETWLNAVLESDRGGRPLLDWGDLVGKLFLDGECAVIAIPSDAHWADAPDWLDSLDEAEYRKLDDDERGSYRPKDEVDEVSDDDTVRDWVRVDDDGRPIPKRRYFRDERGRTEDDEHYAGRRRFKEDRSRTRRAWEEEEKAWLARRLPFEVRIISAEDCLPIFSAGEQLEGLLVRTRHDRESISRDYIWGDDEDLLIAGEDPSDEDGFTTDADGVLVYEYWGVDRDGAPFVAYSVEGLPTKFRSSNDDEPADAIIDLRERFSLSRLPVRYAWGLHLPTNDPTRKGVPYLWPVLQDIRGIEAQITARQVWANKHALGAPMIELNPALLERFGEILVPKDGRPYSFTQDPTRVTVVPGKPHWPAAPPPGAGVDQLLQFQLQAAAAMAPSEVAFGGGSAASGHDRALAREYLETAMSQVLGEPGPAPGGALGAAKFVAEMVLEAAVLIGKAKKCPVPVNANVEVVQTGEAGRTAAQRQVVELKPDWVGDVYEVEAFFPKSEGENIAEREILAQHHMQGLIPYRIFAEQGYGAENPEAWLVEIYVDQALRSDQGRQRVYELAAEMWGDELRSERDRLIEEGKLSPTGTPIAGLEPPDPFDQPSEKLGGFAPADIVGDAQVPPGVDPVTFARHMQLDRSHAAARQAVAGSGPLGPAMGPAAPAGGFIPPGVEQPAGPVNYAEQFADAPTRPGMGPGPTIADRMLAGINAGSRGTNARLYHERNRPTDGGPLG